MFVPRRNLDPQFARDTKFLEHKYNCIIVYHYIGDDFYANVSSCDNFDICEDFKIGNRDTTKERKYINLSRALKKSQFNP